MKRIDKQGGRKMETRRIEKIFVVMLTVSFLSCIIYNEAFAFGRWGPGNGPVRQAFRNAFGGGRGGSGGGGGGCGGCGGGGSSSSEGYSQSSGSGSTVQQSSSSKAQSSGETKSSAKSQAFSTPCTSYTTKIEAGGETLTFEKVPGKQNKFQAGDTAQSPSEIVAKAKTMIADPSVRVTTDSFYDPAKTTVAQARADLWRTDQGPRGTTPEVTGGGMAPLSVRQTLYPSDLQALDFGGMVERMGVATKPGTENQAKIAYNEAYKTLNALDSSRLKLIKENGENAPTGLETIGPKIAGEILEKRATAERKAQEARATARAEFMSNGTSRADLRNPEMLDTRQKKAIELGFTTPEGTADLAAFDQAIKTHEDAMIQTGLESSPTRREMVADPGKFAVDRNLDITRTADIKKQAEEYQGKITSLSGQSYTDEVWMNGKKIATFTRLEAKSGGWYAAKDGAEQSWGLEIHDPSIFRDGKITFPKDATVTRYYGTHEQFTQGTPAAVNRSVSIGALYAAGDMKKFIYAPAAEGVTGQIAPRIKMNGTLIGNVATFDFDIQ